MLKRKKFLIYNILYFLNFNNLKEKIWIKLSINGFKLKYYMLNSKLAIYNGKYFIPIKVNSNMLNLIVNFFFFTRTILLKEKFNKRIRIKKKKKKK